ncbi:electron transport complex subunit E [candidate division NPL-UPA2 bacterium]|nr:electron transport complex subunit E [candidate division NPL-UPA2 bacterium]
MSTLKGEFTKGVFQENPVFVLLLGLCPALAVSVSVKNGLGMGIAATFVLLGSNLIISLLRKFIPARIRIPCFIVVIATFVVIVEQMMGAFSPELARALGIFIPLIVVNCIILGRAEAFASRNSLLRSLADALGMGIGFTLALLLISAIREILGSGRLLGLLVFPGFNPMILMLLPPGAFLTLGLLMGLFNLRRNKKVITRVQDSGVHGS